MSGEASPNTSTNPILTAPAADDGIALTRTSTTASQVAFAEPPKPERSSTTPTAPIPMTRVPTTGSTKDGKPLAPIREGAAPPGDEGVGAPVVAKKKKKAANLDITEHMLSHDELMAKMETKFDSAAAAESHGLTAAEAAKRLEANGPNQLTPPKEKSALARFFGFLMNLFNLLLIIAGVLNYILVALSPNSTDGFIYGSILIGVALLNASIEYYQEAKSAAILKGFLNMIPSNTTAMRDGKLTVMPAIDLVLGDVVFVRLGDKVPADLALFHVSELKVDNSSLTGEAEPQERKGKNITGSRNPLEASNLAFNGTLAVAGEGYGVVVRTGDQTVLGQIANMTDGEKKRPSPMSIEIDNLVKFTATIAVVVAIVFFGIGFKVFGTAKIGLNVNFAIGILVAFVPQGLPATVTMLLTIAAKRLASESILIKDLQGVETLGAITLLATDKTGTLTRNAMTVTNIWSGLNLYAATRSATDQNAPFTPDIKGGQDILESAALNSRARWDRTDVPMAQRTILGDATETGLMLWASTTLPGFETVHKTYPKVFEIPFNSENKWAMTIHKKKHDSGEFSLYQKGAPERILRLCTTILIDGVAVPLTEEHKTAYNEAYEFLAGTGQRVLAFAQALLPSADYPSTHEFDKEKGNYPTDTLTFLGLISLEDPPKHGVREAVGRCRSAGVQIIMVTGDHPLTAEAIGRKINIMLTETKDQIAKRRKIPVEQVDENDVDAIVIHGEQIDDLEDADWDNIFSKTEIIFARTSPKHKLTIVKRAQEMGHIVGVTGDGVNDSPALKKADLGIAMNISGSDVSKEAAAMILLDDNFASVVKGIEQGRLIFMNLKKSIMYTITHTLPELMAPILFMVIPVPLPLSSILILLIDLGFELGAALSFAWDKPESSVGLMKAQPRKPVTFESIDRLRARKARDDARRAKLGYRTDAESGAETRPGYATILADKIATPFRRQFWRDVTEDTENEILVDLNVLSYAYLEMGVIEAIAATTTYFAVFWYAAGMTPSAVRTAQNAQTATDSQFASASALAYQVPGGELLQPAKQIHVLAMAQGAYYLSVMISQMCNMFISKAKTRLPFGKYIVANYVSYLAVAFGALFGFFIVFTPVVSTALGAAPTDPFFILGIPVAFCVVQVMYVSFRVLFRRKFRPQRLNAEIDGLQMYPTVRSQRSGRSQR